jgi:hypothetical protein
METRCGTWNTRIPCRLGSLKTVARELARYKLDLVGVQEVSWNSGGKERTEDTFSVEREVKIIRDTIFFKITEENQQL